MSGSFRISDLRGKKLTKSSSLIIREKINEKLFANNKQNKKKKRKEA